MTRETALQKMARFEPFAVALGLTMSDGDLNMGPALDSALRALGVEESVIETYDVPVVDIGSFLALLEYSLLSLFLDRAIGLVDTKSSSGVSQALSQITKNIQGRHGKAESDRERLEAGHLL